jgi:hypothetical protein
LGALHGSQVRRHLPILVLFNLQHLLTTRAHAIHEPPHRVGVGGEARAHLIVQRATPLGLLEHHFAPLRPKALLRSAQLRRLIGRQLQILLHLIAEALLDLRAQAARLTRITRLLRRENRRGQDGETE